MAEMEGTFYLKRPHFIRCDYLFFPEGILQLTTRTEMVQHNLYKPTTVQFLQETACPSQNKLRIKFENEEEFEMVFIDSSKKKRFLRILKQYLKASRRINMTSTQCFGRFINFLTN